MPKSLFAAVFAFAMLLLVFMALTPIHAQTSGDNAAAASTENKTSVAIIDSIEDLSMMVLLGAPGEQDESKVKRKDYVFGIRAFGAAKAWPVEAFRETSIINDEVGGIRVVLIGDAVTRTVRAYESDGLTFSTGYEGKLTGPDGAWSRTEAFIIGPDGRKLPRVPGHIAYWFAWDGYLGVESALYNG